MTAAVAAAVGWWLAGEPRSGHRNASDRPAIALIDRWRRGVLSDGRPVSTHRSQELRSVADLLSCCGIVQSSVRVLRVRRDAFEVFGAGERFDYLALLTRVRESAAAAVIVFLRVRGRLVVVIGRAFDGSITAWVEPDLLRSP